MFSEVSKRARCSVGVTVAARSPTLLRAAVDRSARADFPNVIVLIRYDSFCLVRSYTIYNTKSNWLQSPALILATWFPSLF